MSEVIFLSTHCPKCHVMETKLAKANIKYTEINDIETIKSYGVKMAPVLVVDGNVLDFKAGLDWIKSQEVQ